MKQVAGRQKPHAARTAKTIGKDNTEYLSEAERLVACFEKIVERNLDRVLQRAEPKLRQALSTVRHPSKAIRLLDIENVCVAWRTMQVRWNELPVGEVVRLEWASGGSGKRRRK